MTKILFVCVGNQGRSVMAERLLRFVASEHEALSAGAMPGEAAHPEVLAALGELGIDASDHVPRQLDDELLSWADVIVSTCDGVCPATPGRRRVDWNVRDPMNKPMHEVRAIRDEIFDHIRQLVPEL